MEFHVRVIERKTITLFIILAYLSVPCLLSCRILEKYVMKPDIDW